MVACRATWGTAAQQTWAGYGSATAKKVSEFLPSVERLRMLRLWATPSAWGLGLQSLRVRPSGVPSYDGSFRGPASPRAGHTVDVTATAIGARLPCQVNYLLFPLFAICCCFVLVKHRGRMNFMLLKDRMLVQD